MTVQIGNLSYIKNLPLHDFFYSITIPDAETHTGNPLDGLVSPNSSDIFTVIY